MNDSETVIVGAPIVAEFVDDAAEYRPATPEFVDTTSRLSSSAKKLSDSRYPFSPPSKKAATAAKKFWMRAIKMLTRPVEGKAGLREISPEDAGDGCITVYFGVASPSHAFRADCTFLDTNDDMFLLVSATHGVDRRVFPIPWTEIASMSLQTSRAAKSA